MVMKASFAAQFPSKSVMSFEEFDQQMRRPGPIVLDSENQASTTNAKEESVMTNAQNAQVAELTKIVEAQAAQIAALTQVLQQMMASVQAPAPSVAPAVPAAPAQVVDQTPAKTPSVLEALMAMEEQARKEFLGLAMNGKANTPECEAAMQRMKELSAQVEAERKKNSITTKVEGAVQYVNQQAGNIATTVTERVEKATPHIAGIATTAAALGFGVARTGLTAATQVGNIVLDTAEALVDPTLKGLSVAVEETGKLIRSLFGR